MERKLRRVCIVARTCIPIKVMAVLFCVLFLGLFSPNYAHAAICFLPDCEDRKVNEGGDTGAEACLNAGYESDKSLLCHEYSIIKYCPQNSNYIKCDDAQWCMINGYIETECETPYELFNKCPNGQEMYKECKLSMEDLCKEENENYVDLCPAGWTLDPNNLCSYSDEWGECCNMCPGFEYTSETLPPGAQAAASCKSCDGMRYIISNIGDICEGFWDCQDGCEIGSETCMAYNGNIKCKTCKRCEAKCSNETCPDGAECEYENCTQRYCDPIGCKVGHVSYCKAPSITDCAEMGYTSQKGSCPNAMGSFSCPFDDDIVVCINDDGSCCSRYCAGYDYTLESIPPGFVSAGSCGCCGKTMHKIVENSCSGYVLAEECPFGPEAGTETCTSGGVTKYRRCKNCPNATPWKVCPDGYVCTKDECSQTYIPTGCAPKYDQFCDIPETNCEELGYTYLSSDCRADSDILYCPYDSNFARCVQRDQMDCCRSCEKDGYTYTTVPEGYTNLGSCKCCTKTLYKAEPNDCSEYFQDQDCEFGVDTTSQQCRSGDQRYYAACLECSSACEHKTCPSGYVCTLDSCSKTYCPSGCATGYDNYCDAPQTSCEELGYFSYKQAECADQDAVLRCPFDTNKVNC